jgi:hypothetical protein
LLHELEIRSNFDSDRRYLATIPVSLATSYPRDIELPFSLIDNSHPMRGPNAEEATIIMEMFPTAHIVHISPPYLTVVCTSDSTSNLYRWDPLRFY